MANELDANIIIQIENHSAGAAKGVELLATSVANLKNASSGFKGLTSVATSIAKINQAANGINPESFAKLQSVMSGLGTALAPLQSIQKSNLGSVLNQLKKLPDVMSGLNTAFANESQVKAFGDNILRLTDLLRPLATEMEKVSNGFSALPTKLQRAMYSLEKTNSVANRTSNTFSKLGRYLTMGGLYYGLMRIGNVFSKFIKESNAYVENVNLFRVSMGDASDEAIEFANSLGDLLGIDPSQFIRYQGVFKQIGNSFGIINEQATIMSRNLTMLAYDYSSLFNVDVEIAAEKFQSAIVGMARPLRAFGIDIQESEIAVTALNLGLDVNVRSLSQADKAVLRYITIYQKSNSVMGDMTRTISSTANQVRILKAQTTQLVRALGNLLIPIFSKVLPYIIAFVNVLTAAINRLATFFGFEMPKFDYSDLEAGGKLFDDVADSADNASAAIKNATMGFDELNVISESSGTGVGDLGGSLLSGIDLSKYDYTERFLGDVQSAVDKLKPQMEALLNVLLGMATVFAGIKIIKFIGGLAEMFAGKGLFATGVKTITDNFINLSSILKTIISPSLVLWLTGIIATFFALKEAFDKNVYGLRDNWNEVWENIKETFGGVYYRYIQPIMNSIMVLIDKVWTKSLKPLWDNFVELVASIANLLVTVLGKAFNNFSADTQNIFGVVLVGVFKGFTFVVDMTFRVISATIGTFLDILTGVVRFVDSVFKGDWKGAWQSITDLFSNIVTGWTGIFTQPINNIINLINSFISKINSVKLPDWLGGFSTNIPLIPRIVTTSKTPTYVPPRKTGSVSILDIEGFADGGLIYDTTMAMVGEYSNSRTNPEVIAPLSDLQAILANTNTKGGMSAEEIALLREQNDLLRRIADKDTTLEINGRELARAVNKSTKEMGYNVGFTTV